jgi:hypothetical protein
MTRKWNVKKSWAEMKEWLARPPMIALHRHTAHQTIEQLLDRPSTLSNLRVLTGRLQSIAMWKGKEGAVAVLSSDPSGWQALRWSTRYQSWVIRIWSVLTERGEDAMSLLRINRASLCFADAIALGEDVFANWCGSRMVLSIQEGNHGFERWNDSPFPAFMAKLYGRWRGLDLNCEVPSVAPLGVYQDIFDYWESESELGLGMNKICDYHCQRTDDSDDGEFSWGHYNVFPSEILALERIRRELGLATPKIQHALLQTPLAHVPDQIPLQNDPFFEHVVSWIQAGLPEP